MAKFGWFEISHAAVVELVNDSDDIQAGPLYSLSLPPLSTFTLFRNMTFPPTHNFQSTDSDIYKPSHDNLVDTNTAPFSKHKSFVLDTSSVWSLYILIITALIPSQGDRKGDFDDDDYPRAAYPPTSQLPPSDTRTWWQKVRVSQLDGFPIYISCPAPTRLYCLSPLRYHSTSGDNNRSGDRGRYPTAISRGG